MSDSVLHAERIADGKLDLMGYTDLDVLRLAEKLALKKAVQHAREAFEAELIDGDYQASHLKFMRAERMADDIAYHIGRVVDRM